MRVVVDTSILVSFAIRPNQDFERPFDYLAGHGVTLVSEEIQRSGSGTASCLQIRMAVGFLTSRCLGTVLVRCAAGLW